MRLRQFITYIFLVLTMLGAGVVCAATSNIHGQSKIWTLPALTDLALSINPTTKLAWAQVRAAAANVGIVKSAYWPQLGFTADVSGTTHENNNDDNNDDFGCSSSDKYCANLTLNYLVFNFGVTRQQVKNANYQLIASQLTQNETIQQVILQVEQAYYQVLGQQALVDADIISIKEAKTNLDAANALHKQGLATIGDV
ncbi:MAG: TolC family protein, partial [Gammaproteobacteria bacterium]